MAAAPAILNANLKAALTNQSTAGYAEIIPIANAGPAIAAGASRSLHVPLFQTAAPAYTNDSCITITTLLNQWDVYTRDHTPGPGSGGILSGFDFAGAALKDMAPYLFTTIFGVDNAIQYITAAITDSGAGGALTAPLNAYFVALLPILQAIRTNSIAPPPVALAFAPPVQPIPITDGWSFVLNSIAGVHPAAQKMSGANEVYDPPAVGGAAAPVISAVARECIPPGHFIRYAFGLLWRIKTVLGDSWPDTHRQMTTGGKKSSRFTHRKKQYSQRRYKK